MHGYEPMFAMDDSFDTPADFSALQSMILEDIAGRWNGGGTLIDDACRHAMLPAGKLFRPTMLLVSAIAVGGRPEPALAAAVATETGHTASLVHDDIIDGDEMRRGRPSVQGKYGINTAIVAGDLLIFSLFETLASCADSGVPADRVVAAVAAVARAGVDLCRGQSMEAELTSRRLMHVESYIEMIRLKTAALFRAACEVGAILGGGDRRSVEALVSYANHLGVAFQIQDDLLAYVSSNERMGKGASTDIRKGRPVLPVILAYQQADPPTRREIERCLAGRIGAEEALRAMTAICDGSRAIDQAARKAEEHAGKALDALMALEPSPARQHLAWYAVRTLNRDS
jgi:geranylgeranyl diphosphate synthase, type I